MSKLEVKLIKAGNSHAMIIPVTYLKAMKIKKPLETRFEILTDGVSILLRRLKK